MTYIPGYVATLTVNGSNLEVDASDAGISLQNEVLDKTTLGVSSRTFIPGLQNGSLDFTLHTDTDGIVNVQAAFAAASPVLFVFRPGSLGTLDAGQYSGSAIITDMGHAAQVDDNWSTVLTLQISGDVLYTAPV